MMFYYFWLAIAMASFFYLGIPVLGAFRARGAWRNFRRRLYSLSFAPRLRYADYADKEGFAGTFRFSGAVDAFEGEDVVWASDGRQDVRVALSSAYVHFLSVETNDEDGPTLRKIRWQDVRSIADGTRVFVAGEVAAREGRAEFGSEGTKPLVLLHELDDAQVLDIAVRAARHSNEYWNEFTQASLILGLAAMGLLMYFALGEGMLPTVAMLTMEITVLPLLPLLPPGLVFFMGYRVLWRKGRSCRAERDSLRMTLRHFIGEAGTPTTRDRIYTLADGTRLAARELDSGGSPVAACVFGFPSDKVPPEIPRIPAFRAEDRASGYCTLIGRPSMEGDALVSIERLDDPMMPFAAIDGDAELREGRAGLRGKWYAVWALSLFVAGVALNFVIAFALFRFLNP